MTGNRTLWFALALLALPIAVAAFGVGVGGAIFLVVLALLWRWAITLSGIVAPVSVPELELETISASHFVEKVRWCMDRLGVDYVERPTGGTLGAFFRGRSVPELKFRTGMVRSVIGNSPEILRFLWGRYAVELGDQAAFLQPTPERLELEKRIDRVGVDLQVWVYFHILNDRSLSLHAWGVNNPAIPRWQRLTLRVLFPLLRALILRSFRISPTRHVKAVEHIDAQLADVEARLGDGRQTLLGEERPCWVDFSFAAIHGLWLQPVGYGGGKADSVRIEKEAAPEQMRAQIERWSSRFPLTVAYIEELYQNERATS